MEGSAALKENRLEVDVLPVYAPLLPPRRYKGAYGGRAGGRSHNFAEMLVRLAIRTASYGHGLRWLCAREVQKSLDQSAKRLIEDKIKKFGFGREFGVLENKIRTPGNGLIIFNGMQDHTAATVKSLEGYDGVWVEEANISRRSLDLLTPTFRKDPTPYMPAGSELWFSWNPYQGPDHPNGWEPVDELFRGEGADDDPNIISVFSTYQHNPWLPAPIREDIQRDQRRDPDKYAHIWLGGYETNSEARVFHNYEVVHFDTPANAQFLFGADWGFSIDPSVLVRCFVGRWDGDEVVADPKGDTLFIDQEAYKVGCEIDNTPALFAGSSSKWPNPLGFPGIEGALKWRIRADSARPETISYMKRLGFRIEPAKKGPDSVKDGVEFLKSYDVAIHPRCKYTADEFATYSYKTDRISGAILPVLADKKNHVIDSVRYALEDARRGGISAADYL